MKRYLLLIVVAIILLPFSGYSQGCADAGNDEGVQVFGFIQPQWDMNIAEESEDNTNTFKFNRARVGFIGNIPYDFSYYFVLETSPKYKNPFMLDAFVTYSRFPWAKVSVGQFKSPFSLELNTPCSGLYTINRSKVVTELASPDRDLGFMILGGADTSFVKYAIGFMNGTGKGVWSDDLGATMFDNNTGKDIVGRLVLNPFEFLSIGGSFKHGTAPSAAGLEDEDEKTIFGGEIQVKYDNFLLQGEYIMADFKGSYTTGSVCGGDFAVHEGSVKKAGFFAQAMYMTPWNLQPIIKFESFDADIDKDKETAKASEETDTPYPFDQDLHGFQNTITFGVNYFFNDWTRVQVNYLYQSEELEIFNDMLMIQLQVKF